MRFKLPPGGDVPPAVAARRLGLALEQFLEALPKLVERGFPRADESTGNYDLDAIDQWRRNRYPQLFPRTLTAHSAARDARDVVADRVARLRGG
ncbi:MAG: hypothetical protein IT481_08360 [Gammaproteobacteria bacterium]|nr:hypothetical protein [Gammaproteobacteria bacterium]